MVVFAAEVRYPPRWQRTAGLIHNAARARRGPSLSFCVSLQAVGRVSLASLPSWEKPRGAEAGEHAERDPGRAPDSTGRLGGSSGVPAGRLIHTTEGGRRALPASAGAPCCRWRLLIPGKGVKIN